MASLSKRLRHRVWIQALQPVDPDGDIQTNTGAPIEEWENVAEVWAAIEPLSARTFIAANAQQSKVTGTVTIRYRSDITPAMRLYHEAKNAYYTIEGIMADKESGLEYLTLVCSEGVRNAT